MFVHCIGSAQNYPITVQSELGILAGAHRQCERLYEVTASWDVVVPQNVALDISLAGQGTLLEH